MQVGDLVKLVYSRYNGYGIITKVQHNPPQCHPREVVWYAVRWQNGVEKTTYQADELEVISESR